MKAIGPVATLLACWSMGIRNPEPSIRVLLTVCVIVVGVAISSMGELRFVLTGFLIQGAAVVFEAYKNAMQQSLLGGKTKMSSMTLLYYFAPACTVINAFYILIFEYAALQIRQPANISPLVILANGFLTFGLNIASVTVVSLLLFLRIAKVLTEAQIKKTSSVVLTLSGIPKSILLAVVDMIVYHTPMSLMQGIGFSIAGLGTYYYSLLGSSAVKGADLLTEKKVDPPSKKGEKRDEEAQLVEL